MTHFLYYILHIFVQFEFRHRLRQIKYIEKKIEYLSLHKD